MLDFQMIIKPLLETIQMVLVSTAIATLLGLPIGIGLVIFD